MNLVEFLVSMQSQFRIYHWQTESFAEHKAFGETYENLDDLIDDFMEAYIPRYSRPYKEEGFTFSAVNYSGDVTSIIKSFINILVNELPKAFSPKDTDLLNIRDEMLQLLNKLIYLLSLK